MYGLDKHWSWILLLLVLGVVYVIRRYIQKGLESPHKELTGLRYSVIMFLIATGFLYVSLPFFYYYVPDPGEIRTMDQAISRIERLEENLGKLHEKLDDTKDSLIFYGGVMGILLGSILGYRRRLSSEDLAAAGTDEDMISILDDNKNDGN
jgi:hypothetical protein